MTGMSADVEVARAVVLEGRKRCMLAEDVGGALPGEGLAEAQAPRDLGEDPPILPRLAGRRQERPLARDAALGVGDRAVLLRPGERRQADAAGIDGVAGADRLGDDRRARSPCSAARTASALGRLATGLVAMIQTALISPRPTASNRSTAFRPGFVAMRGALPEAADTIDVGRREIHVRGERVGQARPLRGRPSRWAGR